jgi:hypothetical protein
MLLAFILTLAPTAQSPLQKELAAVESAYDDTEFEDATARASRLMKASDDKLSKAQKKRLHELSAFSFFYLGRKGPAEAQLVALFDLDPEASIDRKKVTPELAQFFDEIHLRWAEAHKGGTTVVQTVPATQQQQPEQHKETQSVERPAFRPVTLIPFGIGQLAIGDYAVGSVLLVLDAALAATMISLYWVRQGEKQGGPYYADPKRAALMQDFQDAAAFALIVVGIIGFIDALVLAPSRVAAKNKVALQPLLVPANGGASVGLGGRF